MEKQGDAWKNNGQHVEKHGKARRRRGEIEIEVEVGIR